MCNINVYTHQVNETLAKLIFQYQMYLDTRNYDHI